MSFRESSPQELQKIEREAYQFMSKNLRGAGKAKAEKRIDYARLMLGSGKMFATVYSLPRIRAREKGLEKAVSEYMKPKRKHTRIGQIFKIKEPDESFTFVEVQKPKSWVKLKRGEVYVATRTPWSTSLYGQIETAGTIAEEKLLPLTQKETKTLLPKLQQIQKQGLERSKLFYTSQKHKVTKPQPRTKIPSPATLHKIESLMPQKLTNKQLVKRLEQLRATKKDWIGGKLSNAYYRRVVDPGGVTGKVPKDVFLFTNLDPTISDFEKELRKRKKETKRFGLPSPVVKKHRRKVKAKKRKAKHKRKVRSFPENIWKVRKI